MEDRLMREGALKMEDRSGGLPGPNDPRRLAVRAGSFVTPEIVTMFTAVSGGDPFAAESAVAQRAWKLLKEWGGTGLLADLAKLARHAHALAEYQQREADECSERRFWEFLLGHYHEVCSFGEALSASTSSEFLVACKYSKNGGCTMPFGAKELYMQALVWMLS
jgi:hypothetical protein